MDFETFIEKALMVFLIVAFALLGISAIIAWIWIGFVGHMWHLPMIGAFGIIMAYVMWYENFKKRED